MQMSDTVVAWPVTAGPPMDKFPFKEREPIFKDDQGDGDAHRFIRNVSEPVV